ncbi:MAG: cytochrome b/b6 domain-containing protein, partial [Thermodesulfovibrionia bacterium]|nr:cytochrome b/b6 domain-containing protein [Thermodesulfovibrionia bacterium]
GKSKALGALAHGIHSYTAYFIVILVSGHLLAALWHHFAIKDGVLRRMLPLKEKESSANNKEEVNQYA